MHSTEPLTLTLTLTLNSLIKVSLTNTNIRNAHISVVDARLNQDVS